MRPMSRMRHHFALRITDLFSHPRSKKPRRISPNEALDLIEKNALRPVRDTWHYSWDIARFFDEMFVYEGRGRLYVYNPNPIHEWAPAPLFSNDSSLDELIAKEGKACPYWFLHLSTFETFLDRRSALSRRPRVHFPSRQTYAPAAARMNCSLEQYPLAKNRDRFIRWYDSLKHPKYHHSGLDCLTGALETSSRAPIEWFSFAALVEKGSGVCKAVQLMISDHRSVSAINAAAERRSGVGYGILLDVELAKDLCGRGYSSMDCGVSRSYGGYKEKVYLDSVKTNCSGEMSFIIRA